MHTFRKKLQKSLGSLVAGGVTTRAGLFIVPPKICFNYTQYRRY